MQIYAYKMGQTVSSQNIKPGKFNKIPFVSIKREKRNKKERRRVALSIKALMDVDEV